MSRRPEHLAPPELFYNEFEAQKYTQNSRMVDIQKQMCRRALELLLLPEDRTSLLLDIGCGSGLSGNIIEEYEHLWIGIDISSAMLGVALERQVDGDLILGDMGQGMPFKAGSFDGAISISALQWLCNADKSFYDPSKRLYKFFSTLFSCLSRTARAVFQFYPENSEQIELITTQATKAGFYGGVSDTESVISYTSRREQVRKMRGKFLKNTKDWIIEKKERRRKQGKKVTEDSKYTGRRRCGKF
ncbi:PREDICTED: probable 18S rRNA (guanine-N(7))-methyltransferase isoform X3 [Eufriesea mexicana]|uniref:probable 18S rRNA (guanine-N(7))-methyltransferase isoform X3 n=1 Tax=Eufriesea mexicana TaxID=516756 RepID=UPI00083C4AF9|nr:PREDICTED: probable 18S rRNA (guanine-N(7))-methyltransferase isoform X3 [Eufriesea mexicana]